MGTYIADQRDDITPLFAGHINVYPMECKYIIHDQSSFLVTFRRPCWTFPSSALAVTSGSPGNGLFGEASDLICDGEPTLNARTTKLSIAITTAKMGMRMGIYGEGYKGREWS